ncbi:MAG: GNAT family N-acetyltransferase [Cyclobacteriaceae bacterium]
MKKHKKKGQFPIITTSRCVLRKIVSDDRSKIYEGLSHPDVIRYYGVHFDTLESTQAQMKWYDSLEKAGTGIWWAICSLDSTIFYGASGFNNVSHEHLKAEIGFWLLPAYWGQGIMKEVVPVILSYGFQSMHLHRIEGIVEAENTNSKKLLEKLGFQYEGTMKECELKNGRFISLDIYAMINNV